MTLKQFGIIKHKCNVHAYLEKGIHNQQFSRMCEACTQTVVKGEVLTRFSCKIFTNSPYVLKALFYTVCTNCMQNLSLMNEDYFLLQSVQELETDLDRGRAWFRIEVYEF